MATQLSNLQGLRLGRFTVPGNDKMVSIGEARELYKEVCKGIPQASTALKKYQGSEITMWAPNEDRHCVFLLSAILDAAVTTSFEITVKLLVPHSPFPSCYTPESLLDLWTHASLGPKWKSIWRQTVFLRQATRCVFSGTHGPMHHFKSYVIDEWTASHQQYRGLDARPGFV